MWLVICIASVVAVYIVCSITVAEYSTYKGFNIQNNPLDHAVRERTSLVMLFNY